MSFDQARWQLAKETLKRQVQALVPELVPDGHRAGRNWMARNPRREDRHAGSFVVWLTGDAAGGFKDYATGESGDILDLVAFVKGLSKSEALAWAEDRCSLRHMSAEKRQALNKQIEHKAARQKERDDRQHTRKISAAARMFHEAQPIGSGSPVARYWWSRGIDIAALRNIEWRWLRFKPDGQYWLDELRPTFPAQLAGFVNGKGVLQAVHMTLLRPDGAGKAPVAKPKLIWPSCRACVIRVCRGDGDMTPEEAAQNGVIAPVVLTEGVEDALSIAMADPAMRVWAAGSLANLLSIEDHPCADSWIVARDNDWGKPQAGKLFERAIVRLRSFGKPVAVIAAKGQGNKDFNDQLRRTG